MSSDLQHTNHGEIGADNARYMVSDETLFHNYRLCEEPAWHQASQSNATTAMYDRRPSSSRTTGSSLMQPSQSSSASASTYVGPPTQDGTISKSGLENTFEVDEQLPTATTTTQRSPLARMRIRYATRFPRAFSRVASVGRYLRGPRPKVDLPNPKPYLDIDFVVKDKRIRIPLESTLSRLVRPLTSPWLFIVCAAAYIIGFAFFARAQSFFTPSDSFITCTSTFWTSLNSCGLNGDACGPFDTTSTFDFRCPAQCDSVILQNPRTIGNEQIAFKPLIVGGGDSNVTYRGDSFICASAIQAGLISRSKGGCASLQLVGNFTNFLPFTAHGLASIGFPTIFPISFRFLDFTSLTHCEDLRNPALAFNILITCILFLILRPKPIVLYWCLVCLGYWHVALFSQPQGSPPPLDVAFGTFLPVLFICYGIWRVAFRFTLPAFSAAKIEATVWYLAPFWVGVLTNLTTDKIPISRLTSSDLKKRSGAITALVIIICIVTVFVINQVRVIRKTGWLPHYLGWYIAGGLVTLVLALLPGLELRLHHYILSLVLLPGTGFPTRLSAAYQGFLLGMFLNGAAAFGLDSILQTAADLRQDAPLGSALPTFLTNSTNFNSSIPFVNQTIHWASLSEGWDGFSLLVDDVERYVGTALNISLAAFEATIPHFFRLAFTDSGQTGDFTMAAVLWPNGTWVDPPPGPS